MFKKNDYLIFQKNVCMVNDILPKVYNNQDYYVLVPIDDNSLSLKVPTNNKSIRPIISKKEANRIVNSISDIPLIEVENEKNMDQEYKRLFALEEHESLVKIIKTSYSRNQKRIDEKKKISEKDNQSFIMAEKYLYNELALALNMTYDEVKEYILEKMYN